jgi:Antitoxin Phd_YefM, type II toxin-antitoxin system
VTKHGEEVAVVVSIEEYRRLTDELPSFKEFLLAAPDLDALEIDRPREWARVVELATQADDTP